MSISQLVTLATLSLLMGTAADASDDAPSGAAMPAAQQTLLIVVGAAGEEEYGQQFTQWADRLQATAQNNSVDWVRIGAPQDSKENDRDRLQAALATQAKQHPEPLWIVLIGHGTFDGRQAKFNLRGPDLTPEQLKEWLVPFQRTVVVVNCASASSPFMNLLAGKNRVLITATKSGYQYNFARLAEYFTAALGDPQADLDKDGQISLLEAYLLSASQVEEYYSQEARLATEFALLDDNGDGRGTPASWFRGVRAVKKPKDDALVDGIRAHQLHLVRSDSEKQMPAELRDRRDQLEKQLAVLRESKPQQSEDDYYAQLLPIMTELARLYETAEAR